MHMEEHLNEGSRIQRKKAKTRLRKKKEKKRSNTRDNRQIKEKKAMQYTRENKANAVRYCNTSSRHLRLINYGERIRTIYAAAEHGRNPVSKHQIQPEYRDEQADAGRDCRTRLARPNSQARTGTEKN